MAVPIFTKKKTLPHVKGGMDSIENIRVDSIIIQVDYSFSCKHVFSPALPQVLKMGIFFI